MENYTFYVHKGLKKQCERKSNFAMTCRWC